MCRVASVHILNHTWSESRFYDWLPCWPSLVINLYLIAFQCCCWMREWRLSRPRRIVILHQVNCVVLQKLCREKMCCVTLTVVDVSDVTYFTNKYLFTVEWTAGIWVRTQTGTCPCKTLLPTLWGLMGSVLPWLPLHFHTLNLFCLILPWNHFLL